MTPIKRIEIFLSNITKAFKGEEVTNITPLTRTEAFLNNIAKAVTGEKTEIDPKTREEAFLADIATAVENGGGGGSSDFSTAVVKVIIPDSLSVSSDDPFPWEIPVLDPALHNYKQTVHEVNKSVPLYKNTIQFETIYPYKKVSGDVVVRLLSNGRNLVVITGDCTLTIDVSGGDDSEPSA